jgi:hypothetical protein
MMQTPVSPQTLNSLVTKYDPSRTGQLNLEGYTNVCLLIAGLFSFYDNKRWMKRK